MLNKQIHIDSLYNVRKPTDEYYSFLADSIAIGIDYVNEAIKLLSSRI